MPLNKDVRRIRKESNITQKEVTDKVHITSQAIIQYEKGKKLKASILEEIIDAL